MTDLIQRIETAPEPRRDLFEETFVLLHPLVPILGGPVEWHKLHNRFNRMLDAQAWTSAAEMLLPDGWHYNVFTVESPASGGLVGHASLRDCNAGPSFYGAASHPSLALLAAILKANGYE